MQQPGTNALEQQRLVDWVTTLLTLAEALKTRTDKAVHARPEEADATVQPHQYEEIDDEPVGAVRDAAVAMPVYGDHADSMQPEYVPMAAAGGGSAEGEELRQRRRAQTDHATSVRDPPPLGNVQEHGASPCVAFVGTALHSALDVEGTARAPGGGGHAQRFGGGGPQPVLPLPTRPHLPAKYGCIACHIPSLPTTNAQFLNRIDPAIFQPRFIPPPTPSQPACLPACLPTCLPACLPDWQK